MAKRDTVTSSCLDLGLRAILTNQQSGESTQDTQTELTFIKKSAFAELAEAGKWAELIAATEKALSSAEANSDARVWWIRAHLKGRTLPVSLLLPPFASLCKYSVQRNEISRLKSELSELASVMIHHMRTTEDQEGQSELHDLIKQHDLFSDEEETGPEDAAEVVSTDKQDELLETQRFFGIETRSQTSRFSKTGVLVMLLFFGAGSLFISYRKRTSVTHLNTVAVIDRVTDRIDLTPEMLLQDLSDRVVLSNLEALRYGIRENTPRSSTPVPESVDSASAPHASNPLPGVEQKSSGSVSVKRTIKKETINVNGPVEGSEFIQGKEREMGIRPQLPRPNVFDRNIDGGVLRAPFDTRRMIVVSSSRVFKRASTSSDVLGQLLSGDKIVVEGVYGNWARIRSRTGRIGFVPVEALGEGLDFRAP